MLAYRLFQIRDGQPTTLFHGVDRDRTMPIGEWIEAEVETVFDGTDGTRYQSGFHVLPSYEGVVSYLRQFRKGRPLLVCRVEVQDTWEKSHSPSDVLLSRWMKVEPTAWVEAGNPIDAPRALTPEEKRQKIEAATKAQSQAS